ncbi:class I SAM-dependent methyltransferase [Acuticoccus sp.]|uniref:class I SAM-dependent methyltransferase n=1 Tax=Acuticoccus sp. TaxID=1904378 RepID=UPI003B52254E
MSVSICPACATSDHRLVLRLEGVPVVCNALAADAATARAAPMGDVELVACPCCGLLYNRAFDEARVAYATSYENALHHSPSFRAFADALMAGLVERHGLRGQTLVEIGCGDGYMLDLARRHGVARAVGFDPSMAERVSPYAGEGIAIVPTLFDAAQLDMPFRAVLCRHVIEHLSDPLTMLRDLRAQVGDADVALYVEVPNADWMLRSVSLWDVIYEHVTYWTAPAMETLLRRSGFAPSAITTGYGDQFLMVEARPAADQPAFVPSRVEAVLAEAATFGARADEAVARWRDRLGAERRAVVWGAGSKGIAFANAVDYGSLIAMVDLNPRKHGLYVPGSAVEVVSPDALGALAPEVVLVSNGLYADEILARMQAMGQSPDIGVITG